MATPIIAKSKGSAPVNQLPSAQKVYQGQSLTLTGLRVSDADAGNSTISVTLSAGHGSLLLGNTQGVEVSYGNDSSRIVISGSQSQINAALSSLIYTPLKSYSGSDTLTMTSSDRGVTSGTEQTDTDALAITVLKVNHAPDANDRSLTTNEDTNLVLRAVDFGFRDIDGHSLASVKITTLPQAGTLAYKGVALSPTRLAAGIEVSAADLTAGKLVFIPAKDANGPAYANFQFELRDNGGTANGGVDLSKPATFTINVTPVNDAPIAGNDSAFASPVLAATGNVLNNDTDPEGDSLRVVGVGVGAESVKQTLQTVAPGYSGTNITGKYGTLHINADGSYSYQVDADYKALKGGSAVENFTYSVSDGHGGVDKATLAITVTRPNTNPLAKDDSSGPNSNAFTGKVLSNDSDADGDRLVVTKVAAGSELDNTFNSLTPLAIGQSIKGVYGSLTMKADGGYSYAIDPKNENYIRLGKDVLTTDNFTYEVSDGRGGVDRATVSLQVRGVNEGPVARNDGSTNYSYTEDDGYGNVLLNDTDIDVGDRLVVSKVGAGLEVSKVVVNNQSQPEATVMGKYGSLSINAMGEYHYDLNPSDPDYLALPAGASYVETFSYEVSDGKGGFSKAQIFVPLLGPNTAPVAVDDKASLTTVSGNVLSNDRDFEHDTLLASGIAAGDEQSNADDALRSIPDYGADAELGVDVTGIYGSLHIDVTGKYTYTVNTSDVDYRALADGETATDSFTYAVSDGQFSDRATLAVKVVGAPSNTAPVAVDDEVSLLPTGGGIGVSIGLELVEEDTRPYQGKIITIRSSEAGGSVTITSAPAVEMEEDGPDSVLQRVGADSLPIGQKVDMGGGGGAEALTFEAAPNTTYYVRVSEYHGYSGSLLLSISGAGSFVLPPVTPTEATGNVLTNDTDADTGDSALLTVIKAGTGLENVATLGNVESGSTATELTGTYGGLSLKADGSYTYTLDPTKTAYKVLAGGTTAADNFTYEVSDGKGGTDKATLAIKVTGVNDAPVAMDDSNVLLATPSTELVATAEFFAPAGFYLVKDKYITLEAGSTYIFSSRNAQGTLLRDPSLALPGSTQNFIGGSVAESFSYTAKVSGSFHLTSIYNEPGSIFVTTVPKVDGVLLENDRDVDGDTLMVKAIAAGDELSNAGKMLSDIPAGVSSASGIEVTGTYGSLHIDALGTYTYTLSVNDTDYVKLAAGQTATDNFTYEVSDGKGGTDKATLAIKVTGINNAPVAHDDTGLLGNVLSNDTDVDVGDTATLAVTGIVAGPEMTGQVFAPVIASAGSSLAGTFGTLAIKTDGSYAYTVDYTDPDYKLLKFGETSTDTFSYQVSDTTGGTDVAKITVTVNNGLQLSDINGSNGFKITADNAFDYAGFSVASIGDINGDGFDDVVVGAPRGAIDGSGNFGKAAVVFGGSDGFSPQLSISELNGDNGFVLNGQYSRDYFGNSVSSAGDINGDGFDDLIVGSYFGYNEVTGYTGSAYVVFGKTTGFSSALNLSQLTQPDGFRVDGLNEVDYFGWSVSSAGDVNADGYDDLVIGAKSASVDGARKAGTSYVIFGHDGKDFSQVSLSALDGKNGFTVLGQSAGDFSGVSVSSAGDFNGDGFDDLIIGATYSDVNGNNSGQSYVIYGHASGFDPKINLSSLSAETGFRIIPEKAFDYNGKSVTSAGDVNGDGYDDLIVSSYFATINGKAATGAAYVIFGGSDQTVDGTIALSALNGSNGFKFYGLNKGDRTGDSVSSAGDFNGDGYDDLIVGAPRSDVNGSSAGQAYLVLGHAGTFSPVLAPADSFVIHGENAADYAGRSVASAGDVNGDGFDDLLIGAYFAENSANVTTGAGYIIYGFDIGNAASGKLLTSAPGHTALIGGAGDDTLIYDPADTLKVDGGNGRDTLAITGSGVTLDLTQAPQSTFKSIEIIDLTGTGNNTLKLNASDLLHIVGSATGTDGQRDNNLLRVDGDDSDKVQLTAGTWMVGGLALNDLDGNDVFNAGYTLYTSGQAKLLVASAITVELPITTPSDVIPAELPLTDQQAVVPNELIVAANFYEIYGGDIVPTKLVGGENVYIDFEATFGTDFPAANLGFTNFPDRYFEPVPTYAVSGYLIAESVSSQVLYDSASYFPVFGVEDNKLLMSFDNYDLRTQSVRVTHDATISSHRLNGENNSPLPSFTVVAGTVNGAAEGNPPLVGADARESDGDKLIKDYIFTGGGSDDVIGGRGEDVIYLENLFIYRVPLEHANRVIINSVDEAGDVIYGYDANDTLVLGYLQQFIDSGSSFVKSSTGLTTLMADPYALTLSSTVNTSTDTAYVDSASLTDLIKVAALFSSHFTFNADRADDDALLVLESSSRRGDFGVYTFESNGMGTEIVKDELTLMAVVHSTGINIDQFSSTISVTDGG